MTETASASSVTRSGPLLTLAVGVALVAGLIVGGGGTAVVMRSMAGPPGGGAPGAGGPPGGGEAQGPPPAAVVVEQAQQQELRNRFTAVGRLAPVTRAEIAAEIEGTLLEAPLEAGDAVVGGETLIARIEEVWARLALQQAEADVASAKVELDQAQRDLEYLESLATSAAAKPKEVADARADVEAERARLAAARAARDLATEQLKRATVIAPFDGWIVAERAEVGERVAPGDLLVELISRGEIDAVIDVPESVINRITVGDEVEVVIDAQRRTVIGKVAQVNPDGTNAARTYAVKVRLDDEDGALKPGMSVTGRLPVEQTTPRLTVPRDAVQFNNGGMVVWVAAPGEEGGMPSAVSVPVEVLFGAGERFAVRALPGPSSQALHPDATVVVQGAERIMFPGMPLATTPSSESTPASGPGNSSETTSASQAQR